MAQYTHSLQYAGRHVIVFAGPNGSGKTSLIDEVRQTGLKGVAQVYAVPEQFINPDQVAKDLIGHFPDQHSRDVAAARAAVMQRREAIESQKPFAFETVMSHPARMSELLILKENGYHVVLTFITTDDVEKNVERVRIRYEIGSTTGHFVAPEKVRERYTRTLDLLPKAAEIADAVFIYDNSVDYDKATLQALIDFTSGLSVSGTAKSWVQDRLVGPLQQRESEWQDLSAYAEHLHLAVSAVDELRGTYLGKIISVTSHFVLQADMEDRTAIIHDRLMLDTCNAEPVNYAPDQLLCVTYFETSAPISSIEQMPV